MFIATIKRSLSIMRKLRTDENDDETFNQFRSSMKAAKPDTPRYSSFFDLDDILAHIATAFEEEPWHNASPTKDGLTRARALTIVILKVNGLYRSDDLLEYT